MPIATVNLQLNQAEIARLAAPGQPANKQCRIAAEAVAVLARRTAPRETGRLAGSIKVHRLGNGWAVIADTEYALFVHEGTRPHLIVARNAKVLRFDMNGNAVFAAKVKHPGTKAQPWLVRALEQVVGRSRD